MITKIRGYENSREPSHEEIKELLDEFRERGIDCRMFPTSGPYTVHLYFERGHCSAYGPTRVREELKHQLDKLIEELEG